MWAIFFLWGPIWPTTSSMEEYWLFFKTRGECSVLMPNYLLRAGDSLFQNTLDHILSVS